MCLDHFSTNLNYFTLHLCVNSVDALVKLDPSNYHVDGPWSAQWCWTLHGLELSFPQWSFSFSKQSIRIPLKQSIDSQWGFEEFRSCFSRMMSALISLYVNWNSCLLLLFLDRRSRFFPWLFSVTESLQLSACSSCRDPMPVGNYAHEHQRSWCRYMGLTK